MAITHVAGGTTADGVNNGNTVTLTLPTLLVNDVVVVWGGHFPRSGIAAKPTGYTTLYDSTDAGTSPHVALSYKVMGSTPDTTVACPGTGNAADGTAYLYFCLRGVDTGTVPDATATSAGVTTSTTPDPPSITTVTNGAEVLAFFIATLSDTTITYPGGSYTNTRSINGNDTNAVTIGGASVNKATAGAENPGAFGGIASTPWRAVTAAFRPASIVAKAGTETIAPKITEGTASLVKSSTRTDTIAPVITEVSAVRNTMTVTDVVATVIIDARNTLAEGFDFQVRGVNAEGSGAWSNTATVWLPIPATPPAPTIAVTSDVGDDTPTVSLESTDILVGDVVHFEIDTVNTFDSGDLIEVSNTIDEDEFGDSVLDFTSGPLAADVWYFRAYVTRAGAFEDGPYSNTDSIDTAPVAGGNEWNDADQISFGTPHLVVTDGGRTVTTSFAGNTNEVIRALHAMDGPYYFEVRLTAMVTAHGFGISTLTAPMTSALGSATPSTSMYQFSYQLYCEDSSAHWLGGTPAVLFGAAPVAGDLLSFAINPDSTPPKFWVRLNAAGWLNGVGGSQNPATGAGGIEIPFAGPYYPVCKMDANDDDTFTTNWLDSDWEGSPPSGFTHDVA